MAAFLRLAREAARGATDPRAEIEFVRASFECPEYSEDFGGLIEGLYAPEELPVILRVVGDVRKAMRRKAKPLNQRRETRRKRVSPSP